MIFKLKSSLAQQSLKLDEKTMTTTLGRYRWAFIDIYKQYVIQSCYIYIITNKSFFSCFHYFCCVLNLLKTSGKQKPLINRRTTGLLQMIVQITEFRRRTINYLQKSTHKLLYLNVPSNNIGTTEVIPYLKWLAACVAYTYTERGKRGSCLHIGRCLSLYIQGVPKKGNDKNISSYTLEVIQSYLYY